MHLDTSLLIAPHFAAGGPTWACLALCCCCAATSVGFLEKGFIPRRDQRRKFESCSNDRRSRPERRVAVCMRAWESVERNLINVYYLLLWSFGRSRLLPPLSGVRPAAQMLKELTCSLCKIPSKMALLGAVWAGGGSHRDIRGTHVVDDILGNIGTGGGALKAPIEPTRPANSAILPNRQT